MDRDACMSKKVRSSTIYLGRRKIRSYEFYFCDEIKSNASILGCNLQQITNWKTAATILLFYSSQVKFVSFNVLSYFATSRRILSSISRKTVIKLNKAGARFVFKYCPFENQNGAQFKKSEKQFLKISSNCNVHPCNRA